MKDEILMSNSIQHFGYFKTLFMCTWLCLLVYSAENLMMEYFSPASDLNE